MGGLLIGNDEERIGCEGHGKASSVQRRKAEVNVLVARAEMNKVFDATRRTKVGKEGFDVNKMAFPVL